MNRTLFPINIPYIDRETKAEFIFKKYESILTGKILDVGADQCFLKKHLPVNVEYTGVGLGDNPDLIVIDLEKEKLPFPANSFNCVLCLDVLEHLENIHEMFDELCRVTEKYVIISLPNPWAVFMSYLQNGKYKEDRNIKFYGLTKEREPDRHKWFFSASEAKEFVRYRAAKNNMEIIDLYIAGEGNEGLFTTKTLKKEKHYLKRIMKARSLLFCKDIYFPDLYEGTHWWVLRKSMEQNDKK